MRIVTGLILCLLSLIPQVFGSDASKVRVDAVKGGRLHSQDDWTVMTGKVEVKNGHAIIFADGTQFEVVDGLKSDQQGTIDGKAYPAGKEAAEFLRKLIGDRDVTVYINGTIEEYRTSRVGWKCYVGETNLCHAMIAGGWGFATHSSMVPAEIMARENKRGMWRGTLDPPPAP